MIEQILEELKTLLTTDYIPILVDLNTPELLLDMPREQDVVLYVLDIDKYKTNATFFMLPENQTINELTIGDNEVEDNATIYIVCRNDKEENLTKKVLRYTAGLKKLLKEQPTLNGLVGNTKITSAEYYHAVEGNVNIKGAEISLVFSYEE